MTTSTLAPSADSEHLDLADMRRRIKAIFIGSIGNLVEWYDFYAYAAFALPSLGRKLFCEAQASISVPSTEKCSSDSSGLTRG